MSRMFQLSAATAQALIDSPDLIEDLTARDTDLSLQVTDLLTSSSPPPRVSLQTEEGVWDRNDKAERQVWAQVEVVEHLDWMMGDFSQNIIDGPGPGGAL